MQGIAILPPIIVDHWSFARRETEKWTPLSVRARKPVLIIQRHEKGASTCANAPKTDTLFVLQAQRDGVYGYNESNLGIARKETPTQTLESRA